MIISFWSPVKGQGHVTSSMLASISMFAFDYQDRFLVLDAKGGVEPQLAFANVFEGTFNSGQEGLLSVKRLYDSGKLDGDALARCCTTVVEGRLEILVTSDVAKSERDRLLKQALLSAKKTYSCTYVDLGAGDLSEVEQGILEMSDLVVVCLPQNTKKISTLKETFRPKLEGKKVHYVVGRFEESSAVTVSKVASAVTVKAKEISVIPRSVSLMDALGKDNLFDFLQRAVTAKKSLLKMNEEEQCVRKVREFNETVVDKLDLLLDKEVTR